MCRAAMRAPRVETLFACPLLQSPPAPPVLFGPVPSGVNPAKESLSAQHRRYSIGQVSELLLLIRNHHGSLVRIGGGLVRSAPVT